MCQVFEEMQATNIPMTTVTYNSALSACEEGGQWETALNLYQQMRQSADAAPDSLTYKCEHHWTSEPENGHIPLTDLLSVFCAFV